MRKVLVVDDDPVLRDMMVDMLEFEGYDVEVARNGYEALERMRGRNDYIVFLDLMMPGLNGSELCHVLDAEPQLRRRHVIVLTTAMDRQEEVQSLNVDTALYKPFVVEDVMQILERYAG